MVFGHHLKSIKDFSSSLTTNLFEIIQTFSLSPPFFFFSLQLLFSKFLPRLRALPHLNGHLHDINAYHVVLHFFYLLSWIRHVLNFRASYSFQSLLDPYKEKEVNYVLIIENRTFLMRNSYYRLYLFSPFYVFPS
jgi:hypothetical protein